MCIRDRYSGCRFCLKQIIENRRELSLETYSAFIDFQKAFDSQNRDTLWKILIRRSFSYHFTKMIKHLYQNTSVFIDTGKRFTRPVKANKEVKQACYISTTFFNV